MRATVRTGRAEAVLDQSPDLQRTLDAARAVQECATDLIEDSRRLAAESKRLAVESTALIEEARRLRCGEPKS